MIRVAVITSTQIPVQIGKYKHARLNMVLHRLSVVWLREARFSVGHYLRLLMMRWLTQSLMSYTSSVSYLGPNVSIHTFDAGGVMCILVRRLRRCMDSNPTAKIKIRQISFIKPYLITSNPPCIISRQLFQPHSTLRL